MGPMKRRTIALAAEVLHEVDTSGRRRSGVGHSVAGVLRIHHRRFA